MSSNLSTRKTIFDSRKSTNVYGGVEYTHHRSSDFEIPPGYVALVELTTHKDYFNRVVFTAIKRPRSIERQNCFDTTCQGKRYHQAYCTHELGQSPNNFKKSVLRWGLDAPNGAVNQFHYITRPGDYYLTADKLTNAVLEDCNNPTIIEVFIFPANTVVQVSDAC